PDVARTALASEIAGRPLRFGVEPGDPDLVDAVITLRRTKSAEEIEEMRAASRVTTDAHRLAMRLTRPGGHERALTAAFEAFLAARDCTTGYDTILTQRGEVLHNHAHDAPLEAGRLLLLDGGAELRRSGYTADVTRTWPVDGRYTPRQRAAYDAVLAAQEASIALARPGTPYREIHLAAARVIARFLLDEGLLRGTTVDAAVERGAHALFFPHGVGHLLGLDVHDLKAFGDRGAYPPGAARSAQFGLSYLRLDLPLEAGWTVTIEPGFYVVPAILTDPTLADRFADVLDAATAARWAGFGGIRIEDDVHVTPAGPEILTSGAPKHPHEVEALVGTGASLEELLP
ncbi:MAG TPA: M24B family metallopeptidase, partial [Myxococcota bacterium]|nr:M24B family metallopeptidase [Myxococcota bacterium]